MEDVFVQIMSYALIGLVGLMGLVMAMALVMWGIESLIFLFFIAKVVICLVLLPFAIVYDIVSWLYRLLCERRKKREKHFQNEVDGLLHAG